MATAKIEDILDLSTLEQYVSAIGAGTLLKSVELFQQLLPEYLQSLKTAYQNKDKKALCEEAHKFKGAAGSIGLKRIQQLAQALQHGEEPIWQSAHPQWLADIVSLTEKDLGHLVDYLNSKV
ncbi:Hpt domain-containing protein [Paraferrimonas sedimenticola]|uniref:Sensor histidine kinase n=1 Tax=Paraferrimonas sedimenticola TaxID=375674 RepID=A0AA37VZI0_9GAMM|nr:Hpt domain-containing protein [Paraferrimonas sedimenticola]GLP97209.1 sensor histidine kinase [Paraferrimonas sedimenticola]